MQNRTIKIIYTGLLAGLFSELIFGLLFMSPFIQKILYNPRSQSKLFMKITPSRDLVSSIVGIVILSISHSWLYTVFQNSIPGEQWFRKGLFWGFTIWLLYWVFQEWFIYHTLLNEPILLNLLELVILLIGSLGEGLIISKILYRNPDS